MNSRNASNLRSHMEGELEKQKNREGVTTVQIKQEKMWIFESENTKLMAE